MLSCPAESAFSQAPQSTHAEKRAGGAATLGEGKALILWLVTGVSSLLPGEAYLLLNPPTLMGVDTKV